MVHAHDIADRIELDLVKATGSHPDLQLRRGRLVRRGEVGEGQGRALIHAIATLTFGLRGQGVGPVQDLVAIGRHDAELVVQADFSDAMDLAQAFGALGIGLGLQAAREGGDDLGAAQAGATRAAHGQDEGPAKPRVVLGVELLQAGEFVRGAVREPGLALLVRGLGGELTRHRSFAGQLRVGADQVELLVNAGFAHSLRQGVFQVCQALKGPLCPGGFGNPGRMLVDAVQQGGEGGLVGGVELGQREVGDDQHGCQAW